METLSISSILKLVEQNAFMAAVGLKDVYYSVWVARKIVNTSGFGGMGNSTSLPVCPTGFQVGQGYLPKSLNKEGHIVSGYLDDLCLQGATYEECLINVIDTIKLLEELGFVVHPLKSVLIPSQEIEILGFVISTVFMTIELTLDKKE